MADLQKMPGGAGLLKKQAGKLKTKERSSVSEYAKSRELLLIFNRKDGGQRFRLRFLKRWNSSQQQGGHHPLPSPRNTVDLLIVLFLHRPTVCDELIFIQHYLQRPPRSGVGGELRRNPDRASRRHTRSMGGVDDSTPKEEEVELSLEEELVEVSFIIKWFNIFCQISSVFFFLHHYINCSVHLYISL